MAKDLEKIKRRVTKGLWGALSLMLLAGWTAWWGMVAFIGFLVPDSWVASSDFFGFLGLFFVAGGFTTYFGSSFLARSRLRARAATSLTARAELDRLSLTDGMAANFHVFDDAWQQLQAVLDDPSLPQADRSAEVTAQLSAARDQLYGLARRHDEARKEIHQLRLYSQTPLIEASREEKSTELTRLEVEAEAIVVETRKLAATAEQVRQLTGDRSAETTASLKDAVSQFNLTLAAYREVEAIEKPAVAAQRVKKAQRESA